MSVGIARPTFASTSASIAQPNVKATTTPAPTNTAVSSSTAVCTYFFTPGYYMNNGPMGSGGGFPRIQPLLPFLPLTLTASLITALENNGVGGGQPSESVAQFFTIDLNLAGYLQATQQAPGSVTFTYNGQNVVTALQALLADLSVDANGNVVVSNQSSFVSGVGALGYLALDGTSPCLVTAGVPAPNTPTATNTAVPTATNTAVTLPSATATVGGGLPGPGQTPELSSAELLAGGLISVLGVVFLRRRNRSANH